MAKKPFAGERFIFPDSRSLGHAPWDTHTYLQTSPGFVLEAHSGIGHARGNHSGLLSVSPPFYFDLWLNVFS